MTHHANDPNINAKYAAICGLTIYRLQESVLSRRVASRANSTSFFQEVCPKRAGLSYHNYSYFPYNPQRRWKTAVIYSTCRKQEPRISAMLSSAHPLLWGGRALRWA